jgi:hypothetical protein
MRPPKKATNNYKEKEDRSLLFLTLSVVGVFLGLVSSIVFYSFTLIDIYNVSKFYIAFTVIGFILPLKYYQKWFHFIKYEVIIFNLIGMGPFFSGLFLCLNFFLSTNSSTEKYKIEHLYVIGEGHNSTLGIILEDNLFSGEEKITSLKDVLQEEFSGNTHLNLTLADGLFGYKVIREKSFEK